MLNKASKNATRDKIHTRIRKKLAGTTERPRLNVYRSVNHIYVQLIDRTIYVEARTRRGARQLLANPGMHLLAGGILGSLAQHLDLSFAPAFLPGLYRGPVCPSESTSPGLGDTRRILVRQAFT